MRKKALATLTLMLAMALGSVAAEATPAGVEYKADGTAVIWGEALAPPGTPAAVLAYAANRVGG